MRLAAVLTDKEKTVGGSIERRSTRGEWEERDVHSAPGQRRRCSQHQCCRHCEACLLARTCKQGTRDSLQVSLSSRALLHRCLAGQKEEFGGQAVVVALDITLTTRSARIIEAWPRCWIAECRCQSSVCVRVGVGVGVGAERYEDCMREA